MDQKQKELYYKLMTDCQALIPECPNKKAGKLVLACEYCRFDFLVKHMEKKIDELKTANKILTVELGNGKKPKIPDFMDGYKQAVKDTAKEILQGLIEKAYVNECIDLTVNEVKAWFREDYGVEVEE